MIERLAAAYAAAPHTEPSAAELSALNAWIDNQFLAIPCPVRFTVGEVSPELMLDIYYASGVLLISAAHNDSPILAPMANLKFRAAHDWHHVTAQAGFDLAGEVKAFKAAASSAPMVIRWLLHSEIVLQAAAAIANGHFQIQKIVRL